MSYSFIDYPSSGPDQGIIQNLSPAAAAGTAPDAIMGSLTRLYDKTTTKATTSNVYNVLDYDATGNGRTVTVSATSSGYALTTSAAAFSASDVGKLVTIPGAGYSGAVYSSKINSFVSSTEVGVVLPFSTTVSAVVATVGTDDQAAIQSAVNAAAATGGTVFLPANTYCIGSTIAWSSGVSLAGVGLSSIIKPIGPFGTSAAIGVGAGSATLNSPYTGCDFQNFAVDCSGMSDTTYSSGLKGIFLQYCNRCRWMNLYLHDTPATALGCDFLVKCLIHGLHVYNAGRLGISGSSYGASGIGIGSGAYMIEDVTVSDCFVDTACNYGIFIEKQGATSYSSQFAKLIGNNIQNAYKGIGDCGNTYTQIINNAVSNFTVGGIVFDNGTVGSTYTGYQAIIANNSIYGGASVSASGVILNYGNSTANFGRVKVVNNRISGCGQYGVSVLGNATNTITDIELANNDIYGNQLSGVYFSSSGTFTNLRLYNNAIWSNGQAGTTGNTYGVQLSASVSGLEFAGNAIYDTVTKQTYGMALSSGKTLTNPLITGNDFRSNVTGSMLLSGTITGGVVKNNPGYNPVGVAAGTLPASGNTYTAGYTAEVLYLTGGGTLAATQLGQTIANAYPATICLEPGEAVTLTYTGTPSFTVAKK